MKLIEFKTIAHRISTIASLSYNVEQLLDFDKKDTKNEIITVVSNISRHGDYLKFNFWGIDDYFYINKSYNHLDDCKVFYFEKDSIFEYSQSLFTCILISFGLWIYDTQTKYNILYKERGYELSPFKRENYTIECKDDMSLNTVYINESSFIIYNYIKSEYFFVAKNEESKKNIISLLTINGQSKPKEKVLKIEGLINARIDNNHLKGKFYLYNKIVFIDFDCDKEIDNLSSFDNELSNLKSVCNFLNNTEKYNELLNNIIKETVNSSFEQESLTYNLVEEYEKLKSDIYLKKINFYEDCFILVLGSPINFPDVNIYVQLTFDFQIEEITIN